MIPQVSVAVLATTSPTFLPPGELQAGLQAAPCPLDFGKLPTSPPVSLPAQPSAFHQEES